MDIETSDLKNNQSLKLTKLLDIFGPRSIQQYIFIDIIKSIERIANGFLNILAQGGIQLSLQGMQLSQGRE